ncbi:uncharacterized protein [Gossypium hirsutum]|uniref:CCHC-type domain-containing protein n=1 Tax=Gossypium hirsutum TaxID=3635 RepID=A0A1U8KP75_GOSHI|nr:uncharacterized protein LOC107919302 [Gossypium hirsutum]
MSWIKLPGLPGYLYKRNILMEIGGMIEKVAKLDINIDNRARGHFAQMVVYINLNKPLVSQILVNGKAQKVEYEFLPMVCFQCGRYGHVKEACSFRKFDFDAKNESPQSGILSKNQNLDIDGMVEKGKSYGPWMLVERKSWRKVRDPPQMNADNLEKCKGGSRFKALIELDLNVGVSSSDKIEGIGNQQNKGEDIINGDHQKEETLRQSSGQLVSKMVDKGSPNELGFKDIIGLVRLNDAASGSYVGHVLTNRLAGGAHFRNGESRKNLKEPNKMLEFNGPLEALDGSLGIASEVRVGNLDPSKHTVVIFKENKEPKVDFKDERNIGLIVEKAVVHKNGTVIISEVGE